MSKLEDEKDKIGLKQLRDQREVIINKWKKLGLLEGLDDSIKENVAKLFECEQSHVINENPVAQTEKDFDEAFKNFPIKLKKMSVKMEEVQKINKNKQK